MHRLPWLLTLVAAVVAPDLAAPDTAPNSSCCTSSATPAPSMVTPGSRVADPKPRRPPRPGKADSPMLNYIFDSYATNNKHFHDKFRPPSFETGVDSDDTYLDADTGSTVMLDCKVTSLRDKKVAWLKVSDNDNLELLTVDLDTHTADPRFRVELSGDNWRLGIVEAREQDSGLYCCQVSTHPPLLRRVQLIVHPPELKLSKETFLETGETLSLKCAVLHLHPGRATPALHWYRGNASTTLDELRGGVLVDTDHLALTSQLQVAELTTEDAGNYTCAIETPIVMRATTRVHVLQGSSLAELQSGVKSPSAHKILLLTGFLIALCKTFASDALPRRER